MNLTFIWLLAAFVVALIIVQFVLHAAPDQFWHAVEEKNPSLAAQLWQFSHPIAVLRSGTKPPVHEDPDY